MFKINSLIKFIGSATVLMMMTGCGLNFTIKDPALSSIDYGGQGGTPVTLTIVDQRTDVDASFLLGKFGAFGKMTKDLPISIKLENMEDPIGFFARHLERELNSRKIPVRCVVAKTSPGGLTLRIHRYQIANQRNTGFSPWEAFHLFSATLVKDGNEKIIKSYFYNGKVPVWSMDEIEEPCFTTPISILIKDVASKVNQAVFNLRSPDGQVNRLAGEISSELGKNNSNLFWKVLELGHTNNGSAMEPLKRYAQEGDEFFKSCALSAIGALGAGGQLEFLKQRYAEGRYNDRYMAVKAIGDLGTPEALQFIQGLKKEGAYEGEGGLKYCVDLYVP